jgi:hypothetical protein
MRLIYPLVFGIGSSSIATHLSLGPSELNYWLVSAPFVLVGAFLFVKG